jgi:molecular chaperone HscB
MRNHFELFDLPVSWQIDGQRLASRYRELQREVHPDRFAHASSQERRLSLELASQVNEGYRVLRDPVARALYLLELNAVARPNDAQTMNDPEFLMQQMELREELDEASGDEAQLDQFAARMQETLDQEGAHFMQQLQQDPNAAVTTAQRMQFFQRLQQQAEQALEQF